MTPPLRAPPSAAAALLEQGPGERGARRRLRHRPRPVPAHRAAGDGAGGDNEERAPLVMLVDDAQWADGPSLRFLAYLAERLADLPIALVVSMRPGEPGADATGLGALRVAAGDWLLRLQSLTRPAVRRSSRPSFAERRRRLLRRVRADHRRQPVPAARAARAGARRRPGARPDARPGGSVISRPTRSSTPWWRVWARCRPPCARWHWRWRSWATARRCATWPR